jgi:molecular chaperone GrpE
MKHKGKEKPKEQEEPTRSEPVESKAKNSELEELRRQAGDLQKERDELFGKLQRVSADYINFQKRASKQIADTVAYEKEKIIKTFLPALDNLEHTLQNAHAAKNADVLIKGIQIIYDQILDTLKMHGIEHVKALDEKFDPALHEVIMQKAEPEKGENVVLEELQKGYKLNGRVIRPSRVIVNKLPSAQEVPPEQEQTEQEPTDVEDKTTDNTSDERRDTRNE